MSRQGWGGAISSLKVSFLGPTYIYTSINNTLISIKADERDKDVRDAAERVLIEIDSFISLGPSEALKLLNKRGDNSNNNTKVI